jgi:NADPH:quinone reductase
MWTTSPDPVRLEKVENFVVDGLAKRSLKPVIDRLFPLEEIIEAHWYIETKLRTVR